MLKNQKQAFNVEQLVASAKEMRLLILETANKSRCGHLGSCLSIVEILTYLYHHELDINAHNSDSDNRDCFILSKGHAALSLYAVLFQKGILTRNMLSGFMEEDGTLPAHLDRFSAPGIDVSAGSLGHGLSMGLGLAHGNLLRGRNNRVVVLMGDGEMQEGSVWEAAMMAPKLGVGNLTVIVDHNNLQGYGRPTELMHFEPVEDKWRAFGWNAVSADGHDFQAIHDALSTPFDTNRPRALILRTVKGKGVSFMEDEMKWHYFIVTDELLEQAKKEVAHA